METLHIYNAINESLVKFVPGDPYDVKIYCCGPTVYDLPHLGHARTYVFMDVIRRILRYHFGFGVRTVLNITDLNDDILKMDDNSQVRQYEKAFFTTMDLLNVTRPDFSPRVTDNLHAANHLSKTCVSKEIGYYSRNFENTYFSTTAYLNKFHRVFPQTLKQDNQFEKEKRKLDDQFEKEKQKLDDQFEKEKQKLDDQFEKEKQKQNDQFEKEKRDKSSKKEKQEPDQFEKEKVDKPSKKEKQETDQFEKEKRDKPSKKEKWDPRDFAIFKQRAWTDSEGNSQTKIAGWHTGCATIACSHFPNYVDILLGGIDLQFTHHENQIALARAFLDKKDWARYCLYGGHLEIDGQKMSKTLKNFTKVEEMMEKGFSPLAIRYMFMKFPYNKRMSFHKDELEKAQKSYDNFMNHIQRLKSRLIELKPKEINQDFDSKVMDQVSYQKEVMELNRVKKEIDGYLKENFNVPKAIEVLENYVQGISGILNHLSYEWLHYSLQYILWMADTCFGLMPKPPDLAKASNRLYVILKTFRAHVRDEALMKGTNDTLRESFLKMCDIVREEMQETGYTIEDEKAESVERKI